MASKSVRTFVQISGTALQSLKRSMFLNGIHWNIWLQVSFSSFVLSNTPFSHLFLIIISAPPPPQTKTLSVEIYRVCEEMSRFWHLLQDPGRGHCFSSLYSARNRIKQPLENLFVVLQTSLYLTLYAALRQFLWIMQCGKLLDYNLILITHKCIPINRVLDRKTTKFRQWSSQRKVQFYIVHLKKSEMWKQNWALSFIAWVMRFKTRAKGSRLLHWLTWTITFTNFNRYAFHRQICFATRTVFCHILLCEKSRCLRQKFPYHVLFLQHWRHTADAKAI